MKRYKANGKRIKELRETRERASTQKELAHEVGIGERSLRKIENEDTELTVADLERLGKAFGVPWKSLVFAADGPMLVRDGNGEAPTKAELPMVLVPRFEDASVTAVTDPEKLLSVARSYSIVFHILTTLTAETEVYADKMIEILKGAHQIYRQTLAPSDGREEIRFRRELRELLVLLKGNDVWVYETSEFKHLPESFEVQQRDKVETWFQAIIAFGPAGEYGENTIKVPVDHGQPWLYDPNIKF